MRWSDLDWIGCGIVWENESFEWKGLGFNGLGLLLKIHFSERIVEKDRGKGLVIGFLAG